MQGMVIFLKMETANYEFLPNNDTFFGNQEIKISFRTHKRKLYNASYIINTCYCLNPRGILNSKTYLYCGTNQVLNANENDLISYVCFSVKSVSFIFLLKGQNNPCVPISLIVQYLKRPQNLAYVPSSLHPEG